MKCPLIAGFFIPATVGIKPSPVIVFITQKFRRHGNCKFVIKPLIGFLQIGKIITMKYAFLVAGFLYWTVTFAQSTTADSAAILIKEAKSLALKEKITAKSQSINENKMKLMELEKTSTEKAISSGEANKTSAESMIKNTEAADKLENNANDKKYARRSFKASRQARRDAKQARKAASRADNAEDDITSLRKKIEKEEKELEKLNEQMIEEQKEN
jgi:hypothetical protein